MRCVGDWSNRLTLPCGRQVLELVVFTVLDPTTEDGFATGVVGACADHVNEAHRLGMSTAVSDGMSVQVLTPSDADEVLADLESGGDAVWLASPKVTHARV